MTCSMLKKSTCAMLMVHKITLRQVHSLNPGTLAWWHISYTPCTKNTFFATAHPHLTGSHRFYLGLLVLVKLVSRQQVQHFYSYVSGSCRPPSFFLWLKRHNASVRRVCTRVSKLLYFEVPLNYDLVKLKNSCTKVWPNDVANQATYNFFSLFQESYDFFPIF